MKNETHPAVIIFDLVCWILGIVGLVMFLTTAATLWLWIAIIFGSLAVLIILFIATDGFEDLDLF